ncbi:MAG TPA: hypothetical protein DEF45_19190 [Rhodopirellula sp.]|nr:MAG: hypothetical protein CBD74_11045 [Saprospirales bacterium TMED214]HBV65139.1 hypothetical protein [Rhodopirellula sp.]
MQAAKTPLSHAEETRSAGSWGWADFETGVPPSETVCTVTDKPDCPSAKNKVGMPPPSCYAPSLGLLLHDTDGGRNMSPPDIQ